MHGSNYQAVGQGMKINLGAPIQYSSVEDTTSSFIFNVRNHFPTLQASCGQRLFCNCF